MPCGNRSGFVKLQNSHQTQVKVLPRSTTNNNTQGIPGRSAMSFFCFFCSLQVGRFLRREVLQKTNCYWTRRRRWQQLSGRLLARPRWLGRVQKKTREYSQELFFQNTFLRCCCCRRRNKPSSLLVYGRWFTNLYRKTWNEWSHDSFIVGRRSYSWGTWGLLGFQFRVKEAKVW